MGKIDEFGGKMVCGENFLDIVNIFVRANKSFVIAISESILKPEVIGHLFYL